jgi:hypothetical protein
MIEMGLVVALGLLVMLAKLPWKWKLRLVSNPVLVDLCVFCILTFLHWGTFSGVMVATVGALFCSIVLSIARKVVGYIDGNTYRAGWIDVSTRL